MRTPIYCIKCEKEVIPQRSIVGVIHEYNFIDPNYGIPDIGWCFFENGFAYCPPPPELEEDWELHLIEPEIEEEVPSIYLEELGFDDEEPVYSSFGSPD